MKRFWVAALSILFGIICVLYYRAQVAAAEVGEYDNVTAWAPNVQTVHQRVDNDVKRSPGNAKVHLKTFGDLLTQRFRNHDPQKAVRVTFKHDLINNTDMLVLMCPARMEPWNMDWLAVQTWKEAKDDLGASYPIDIFITYIGLSRIKVAELRPVTGDAARVAVRYLSPAQVHREMEGDQAAAESK
jgi:hypothetical protein